MEIRTETVKVLIKTETIDAGCFDIEGDGGTSV